MIPKIIHYCWVGNAPKPKSVLYCIESWKKFCPDYEIKEWNESNYDFSKNHYMKQAYDAKKWGFVPDYARLDIIYQYGGIYLDTDVELVKSFDELLDQDAFMGFENTGDGEYFVNCGQGFGAVPKHEIIKAARDLYDNLEFINFDGTLNMLASPHYTTQTLCQFGLEQKDKEQKLPNMMIYRSDVLCPKNFRTGKLNVTDKTVSIHHFTASWLDDQIKKEMEHQQLLERYFGIKLAKNILLIESVWKKYAGIKLITKLPKRIIYKIKRKIVYLLELLPFYKELVIAKFMSIGKKGAVLLDPSYDGDNEGDRIIMENCLKQLPDKLNRSIRVPTHRLLTEDEQKMINDANIKILCGTNALSGHMRSYGLWRLNKKVGIYKNTILMGIGFASNYKTFDLYTKMLFKIILSKEYVHSVRDKFSESMLHKIGIKNVIYTGCPTMWSLTSELCKKIPKKKSDKVICTLTDYKRDIDKDQKILDILSELYEKVYLWPQGIEDNQYFQELKIRKNIEILDFGLEVYDRILENENLDYVGTRLHAGIRSISKEHRTLIISIDNRAKNIGRDTGLPIIEREKIEMLLKSKIESEFTTKIVMPTKNIEQWKSQFL